MHIKIYHRRKMLIVAAFIVGIGLVLMGRLAYLMIFRSAYYQSQADALHERERSIKAARGLIYDRNQRVLADNKSVCTISVIHNQIKEPEKIIRVLSEVLSLDEAKVRARVENWMGLWWMKIIPVITHTKRWPPKCWVLRAATIRALLG